MPRLKICKIRLISYICEDARDGTTRVDEYIEGMLPSWSCLLVIVKATGLMPCLLLRREEIEQVFAAS